jgi:hypothetical protein
MSAILRRRRLRFLMSPQSSIAVEHRPQTDHAACQRANGDVSCTLWLRHTRSNAALAVGSDDLDTGCEADVRKRRAERLPEFSRVAWIKREWQDAVYEWIDELGFDLRLPTPICPTALIPRSVYPAHCGTSPSDVLKDETGNAGLMIGDAPTARPLQIGRRDQLRVVAQDAQEYRHRSRHKAKRWMQEQPCHQCIDHVEVRISP